MPVNPQYDDKLIREKITGVVIKYVTEKGFGFIRSDDKTIGDDIYVYFNQIVPTKKEEFLKLQQYQHVTFDLYMSRKGLIAKNVIRGEVDTQLLEQNVKG